MDGEYENRTINLKKVFNFQNFPPYLNCLLQVIFYPDNILDLFKQFGVKRQFDLLSVDTDAYDFFMLETILEVGDMRASNTNIRLNLPSRTASDPAL